MVAAPSSWGPKEIVTFTGVQPVKILDVRPALCAHVLGKSRRQVLGTFRKDLRAIQDAVAVDGKKVPLRFTKEARGGGSGGEVGIAVVATAIVFWPATPFGELKKGKKAVLAGQRYQVVVLGDAEGAPQPGP